MVVELQSSSGWLKGYIRGPTRVGPFDGAHYTEHGTCLEGKFNSARYADVGTGMADRFAFLAKNGALPSLEWGPYYGHSWGGKAPPGMPPWVRYAGQTAEGLSLLDATFSCALPTSPIPPAQRGGFAYAYLYLMMAESSCVPGRPADHFSLVKNAAGEIITAWGYHQFNTGAWPRGGGNADRPYGNRSLQLSVSLIDEMLYPVFKYEQVYLDALERKVDAATAVSLYHSSGAKYRKWRDGDTSQATREALSHARDKARKGYNKLRKYLGK